MAPLLSYQDKFTDEMVFSLFYTTAIGQATQHATDIFGSNTAMYLVILNMIVEISCSKAPPAKRGSLIFDEDDKAIEFQMKFENILRYIRAKKRSSIGIWLSVFARTVTGAPIEEKQLSVKAQKLLEQQRRDAADKKKWKLER